MPQRIRTAIVGYGRSGQLLHGTAARANAEAFDVVAVCNRSQPRLEQARKDFPGCATFTNLSEMLAAVELDLVVIVTRNDQHHAMALECLNAGCSILVTKPLATTAAEVTEIKEAAEANGAVVYPFLPCRWASDVRRITEIIASGAIGEVFNIRRTACGFATRDDWQTQTEFGGGILLNWGPHLIDSPLFVVGQRAKTVYGATSQVLNPGDAEDNYFAHLTLADGVRVFSEWTFVPTGLPNWFVQGTGGCIMVTGRELKLVTGTPAKPDDPTDTKAMLGGDLTESEETLGEHVFGDSAEVYADLAQAIRGDAAFPADIDDALHIARVIDAIKASQHTRTLIEV
ncbi:MAG: Gfo/Idh/MocA family oxidoreductase [Planctomycetota bacterium]